MPDIHFLGRGNYIIKPRFKGILPLARHIPFYDSTNILIPVTNLSLLRLEGPLRILLCFNYILAFHQTNEFFFSHIQLCTIHVSKFSHFEWHMFCVVIQGPQSSGSPSSFSLQCFCIQQNVISVVIFTVVISTTVPNTIGPLCFGVASVRIHHL